MVFQDPQACLDPRMTTEQSVAELLNAFRVGTVCRNEEPVLWRLERVGLNPETGFHEFSGWATSTGWHCACACFENRGFLFVTNPSAPWMYPFRRRF